MRHAVTSRKSGRAGGGVGWPSGSRGSGLHPAFLLLPRAPQAAGPTVVTQTGLHTGGTGVTGCVSTPSLCIGFCISALKFVRLEMRSLRSLAGSDGRP